MRAIMLLPMFIMIKAFDISYRKYFGMVWYFLKKGFKMFVYNIDVSMILKSTETSHCYSKQSGPSQLFSELSFSSKSLRIKMVSNFSQNVLSDDINHHTDAEEFHKNTLKDCWDISEDIYVIGCPGLIETFHTRLL